MTSAPRERPGPRLSAAERDAFACDGFLIRHDVFSPAELEPLRAAAESVAERVRRRALRPGAGPEHRLADGHRIQFSSRSAIQWEWAEGSDALRLVEPVDHLDARLAALFDEPRLVEPMKDLLGREAVGPFTSKLNLKRAREGSAFPYHQDYPYWYARVEAHAADVATALVLLDDADETNGALRLLPGSQRGGPAPRDPADPTRSLADPARLDTTREVVAAAGAGAVLFLGSLVVHRSAANRSERDRRAVLLSYQPAGRVRSQDAVYRPELLERLP